MSSALRPSAHRFFAPTLDPGDETVTLSKGESEHLSRVLRLGVGEIVTVFDGRGSEFAARVLEASGRLVRVQVLTRVEPAREAAVSITLGQAVLKGDMMDDVVRDAVMLGVSAVQPLITKRTEVTVANLVRGSRVERWRRVALASTKQSRRAVLPEIRIPLTIDTYLDEPRSALALMLVEPKAGAMPETFATLRTVSPPPEVLVMIGPEGGWAETEWAAAKQRGVRLLTLGERTLRADAVPVAALSVLYFLWELARRSDETQPSA